MGIKHEYPSYPGRPGCRRSTAVFLSALALGIGLVAGGITSALASGSDSVVVCFANSSLLTGNGTWHDLGGGLMDLKGPTWHAGAGTDGHGMLLGGGGFNQGDC